MNNREKIQAVFQHGKAFIPFVTAGDPDLSTTKELLWAMAEAGADLIEVGVPFSDPVAEGPVIQQADVRALAAGTTTDLIFSMLEEFRWRSSIPLAIMTYINPIFVYGPERFMARCAQCGVCAVIVPDLPFEERQELQAACREHDVVLIHMIAPTSKKRIHQIAREAEGFLYCVSSLGVTGMRDTIAPDVGEMIRLVREVSPIPCAIGFGISTPAQAFEMARYGDGVIVGSAIVDMIAQQGRQAAKPVAAYVKQMKEALSGVNYPKEEKTGGLFDD